MKGTVAGVAGRAQREGHGPQVRIRAKCQRLTVVCLGARGGIFRMQVQPPGVPERDGRLDVLVRLVPDNQLHCLFHRCGGKFMVVFVKKAGMAQVIQNTHRFVDVVLPTLTGNALRLDVIHLRGGETAAVEPVVADAVINRIVSGDI